MFFFLFISLMYSKFFIAFSVTCDDDGRNTLRDNVRINLFIAIRIDKLAL